MPAFASDEDKVFKCIICGNVTNSIPKPGDDGLTIDGRQYANVEIEDHVFDFRCIPEADQDEILSGVCAAHVKMRRCILLGGIKAILAGNGDHPIADFGQARWELEDCVIMYSGRRCPEAQDGTAVTMKRCWIHNWGHAFDVRAFGAWAHRGGRIIAEDCLFTQSGGLLGLGLLETIADLCKHVGQVVNDGTIADILRWRTWMPGICRGLTADTGGMVLATRCWKNRWWIRLENGDDMLGRDDALAIGHQLIRTLDNIEGMKPYAKSLWPVLEAL